MGKKLQGQIAIVTGANSGIGAGVAKGLSEEGATTVVNYPFEKAKELADAVVSEITSAGGNAIAYQCDVSKEDQVVKMFSDIVAQFGTVEILVNNAGLQKDASFINMSLADWNLVIGVNLTGYFLCAREAIKEFIRRGKNDRSAALGKIICMGRTCELCGIERWNQHDDENNCAGACTTWYSCQ
jgi:glucose 1-dehydrogenase